MTRNRPGIGIRGAIVQFASLKWHVLLGGLRRSNQSRVQVLSAVVASLLLGGFLLILLGAIGRNAPIADDLLIVFLPVAVVGVGLLSAATGVESTIDPRILATEPLSAWQLGIGMLTTAIIGPPALLAVLTGIGVLLGWGQGGTTHLVVTVVALFGWWASLLLLSRTLANALGAVATTRFRQFAHAGATLASLGALFVTQLLAANPDAWNEQRWENLAEIARWTPPGQLGVAITGDAPLGTSLWHLALGFSWLPLLLLSTVGATRRLSLSSPRPGGGVRRRARRSPLWIPSGGRSGGPIPAIATRTIMTKVRTPRQAVNTITALAVGGAVYFLAPLLGTVVDSRLVIMGGALHFAVLFDGNNAFGMDGPAMWTEVTAGADGRTLVWGKVRSSLMVMTIPGLLLPVGLAAVTGGWRWIPAGWLVAAGSIAAAAGVAVVSAVFAPFALPDSPNPLAGGDTGQGCLAGMMLAACVTALAVVTAPVALGIYLASERSAVAAALAALAAPVFGALTLWGSVQLAVWRVQGAEAELAQKVTPAR
ncbi:MAG: hypothetical protein M9922_12590 [Microthrixaceae bacterium]|nr:hypothetical protein [Microthrixaceae bacterium]